LTVVWHVIYLYTWNVEKLFVYDVIDMSLVVGDFCSGEPPDHWTGNRRFWHVRVLSKLPLLPVTSALVYLFNTAADSRFYHSGYRSSRFSLPSSQTVDSGLSTRGSPPRSSSAGRSSYRFPFSPIPSGFYTPGRRTTHSRSHLSQIVEGPEEVAYSSPGFRTRQRCLCWKRSRPR
jgi:hypothetical protein